MFIYSASINLCCVSFIPTRSFSVLLTNVEKFYTCMLFYAKQHAATASARTAVTIELTRKSIQVKRHIEVESSQILGGPER